MSLIIIFDVTIDSLQCTTYDVLNCISLIRFNNLLLIVQCMLLQYTTSNRAIYLITVPCKNKIPITSITKAKIIPKYSFYENIVINK